MLEATHGARTYLCQPLKSPVLCHPVRQFEIPSGKYFNTQRVLLTQPDGTPVALWEHPATGPIVIAGEFRHTYDKRLGGEQLPDHFCWHLETGLYEARELPNVSVGVARGKPFPK